MELVRA
jgi:hypothetical protein